MSNEFSFNISDISDEEIINYINKREHVTTVSFISPYTGIPHMCPVWGIFLNGSFFFQSEDYTAKVRAIEKRNEKIGVSIIDSSQFPDYSEGSIPYVSFGGTAKIRTKNDFVQFENVLNLIFKKYIENVEERKRILNFVLKEVKTRIIVEIIPEWSKVVKVPKSVEKQEN